VAGGGMGARGMTVVGPGSGVGPGGGGVDVEGGAGCSAGCSACTVSMGPAVMTFVGQGHGDYITETTYKYVGPAAGLYSMLSPKKSFLPQIAMLVALVLIVILAVLLWPQPTTTTTPITTVAPVITRECLFWGDPHIKSFDGARLSFYGDGEFWIVKSDAVKIQGLYKGTKWTHGLAATSKIVVSGSFVQDRKIVVGSLETGDITVDGMPVLTSFPSTYSLDGTASLSYNSEGELVDKGDHDLASKRIVHMDLSSHVRITVMRWENYIDFKIEMPQQPDQDGSCGNFNGRADDDTTEQIMERLGARVADGELLFQHRHVVAFTAEMQAMLAAQCTGASLAKATSECQMELPAASAADLNTLNSCLFDHCFGYNQHALRTAKTYGV